MPSALSIHAPIKIMAQVTGSRVLLVRSCGMTRNTAPRAHEDQGGPHPGDHHVISVVSEQQVGHMGFMPWDI
jgi:hypothetical protein